MEYIQEITLDLNPRVATPILYAKQGDADTRVLEIHLMKDGNEYIPEAGSIVMFRARKPDGTYIVDATSASLNNNIVNVRLTEQTLVEAGRALVDIVLYDGNSQYLSTASFILSIQASPAAAMRGVVSSNEYNIFESLLASVGPAVTSVQAGVASAQAAASSAWAAVNAINDQGIIITASNVLAPGIAPSSIIEKESTNNFYLHSVSVLPSMTASVVMSGSNPATVEVTTSTSGAPTGVDPNLFRNFNLAFTLPENSISVQIDTTLTQPGRAADASAVGTAIQSIVNAIPSEVYGSVEYIIPMAHGGTGATTAPSALAALGAQRAIQTSNIELQSTTTGNPSVKGAWYKDTNTYRYIAPIQIPSGLIFTAAPHFDASPNNLNSWVTAGDITLGPPSAGAPYASNGTSYWDLTFEALDSTSNIINVTVNWW